MKLIASEDLVTGQLLERDGPLFAVGDEVGCKVRAWRDRTKKPVACAYADCKIGGEVDFGWTIPWEACDEPLSRFLQAFRWGTTAEATEPESWRDRPSLL